MPLPPKQSPQTTNPLTIKCWILLLMTHMTTQQSPYFSSLNCINQVSSVTALWDGLVPGITTVVLLARPISFFSSGLPGRTLVLISGTFSVSLAEDVRCGGRGARGRGKGRKDKTTGDRRECFLMHLVYLTFKIVTYRKIGFIISPYSCVSIERKKIIFATMILRKCSMESECYKVQVSSIAV